MQFTTRPSTVQLASIRVHFSVVLSVLVVAVRGCTPEDQAGWITCPPQVIGVASRRPHRRRGHQRQPGSSHSHITAYRWVSAWEYGLLPVAALLGAMRCSGVVGIDEKYVLVPKACGEGSRTNDKPEGKIRRAKRRQPPTAVGSALG